MEQKKKQKKKLLVLSSLELMSLQKRQEILRELTQKLKTLFKEHIGEEESLFMKEIFYEVIGEDMNQLDGYLSFYWASILNTLIRKLRASDEIFIIKRSKVYFVMKTQHESTYYKNLMNRDIKNCENAKVRADNWVRNKKWEHI